MGRVSKLQGIQHPLLASEGTMHIECTKHKYIYTPRKIKVNLSKNKDKVVHICNGILLSRKGKQIIAFLGKWMDLETIISRKKAQLGKTNATFFSKQK